MSESMNMTNGNAPNDFAARLTFLLFRRQALLGKRIYQAELGQEIGRALGREPFTQAAVQKWLAGENEPNFETTGAIARVFGVSAGWLAFGEGEPPNDPAAPEPMPPPRGDLRG